VIIDCHGHYTTAPAAHTAWRAARLEAFRAGRPAPPYPSISDDEIRETIETNQLKLLTERGSDVTVFSPRASAMGQHEGDLAVGVAWARACNDLVARVAALFPGTFVGVAQLPQVAGEPLDAAIAELRRTVDLGFVGVNLNPDPSGGRWTSPPLTDRSWYPLVRGHGRGGRAGHDPRLGALQPGLPHDRAHYLNADTTAFMQLLQGDLFADGPTLRLIIPHGGAVPYHWGRYRGLADMLAKPPLETHLMGNVFFDTCVYHQPGIDLLLSVIGSGNLLFGSEMVGAVRGIDPTTGHYFDDTKRYVDAAVIGDADRQEIYSGTALRVYPRLAAALRAGGHPR